MEQIQKRHRQELKDLQSRITEKKKAATKKTRKGVNDECAQLEQGVKKRQADELAAISGSGEANIIHDNVLMTQEESSRETHENDDSILPMDSIPSQPPATNGHVKKPNRQTARLARRAAEQEAAADEAQKEAAALPDLRKQEQESMRKAYESHGLSEYEIRSDGHCLYAAVADQLQHLSIDLTRDAEPSSKKSKTDPYKITRHMAANFISDHPDDFVPFLDQPLGDYVKTIKDTGEWGGHLEILALAKAYGVDVNVLQGTGQIDKIECGVHDEPPEIWLAYYRHSFGLGEHYNSLRKQG